MKKYNKIVLAGGTGQIGNALVRYFKPLCREIIVLSRSQPRQADGIRYLQWDGKTLGNWQQELEGADVLINLAGKNVNCRYTEKNKKEIFDSRTYSVSVLSEAVKACKTKPALWIQSASATIYRHAEDRPMDEYTGETGTGFSVDVCNKWENTFRKETASLTGMRKVVLRISMVLSSEDGVFPRLTNLARFGLGGKQGNGRQWVSWIHEADVAAIIEWITDQPQLEGTFNCTAPTPVTNTHLMRVVRNARSVPAGINTPSWLLGFGALLIGTETELVLKSRWVLPAKLLENGYRFRYPTIEEAIQVL